MGNSHPSNQVDDDAANNIGPRGKGDPSDFSLTQKEILNNIPKYQMIAAEKFKCLHLYEKYDKCANDSAIAFYSCQNEMKEYLDCREHWSTDADYRDLITAEYLVVREEYRKTGRRRLYRALKGETYVTDEQLRGFKV